MTGLDPVIEIVFLEGPTPRSGGSIRRRIALRLNGEDNDVVTLALDRDQSRSRQAKRWADLFSLDLKVLEEKLRRASIVAAHKEQCSTRKAPEDGLKRPPTTPKDLDAARPTFSRWLRNTDPDLLDVLFGAVMAQRLDGDPVWIMIVGPPGDGKTEVIRSLADHESIYMLSSLTPATLISGYVPDNGSDPSLLPKLDGKILAIKDFTTVLTLPAETRAEILGTLRDAYDGEASKAFGNGETRSYKSRFGLITGVTPVIDKYRGVSAQLGERFLHFQLPSTHRVEKVRQALQNTNEEAQMREELAQASRGVLAQNVPVPITPPEIEERLVHLADFVARARSDVARDRKGVVEYVPRPEVGTRVAKALKKLGMGITMARGNKTVDEDIYRIPRRVALDTLPSMRGRLLEVLWSFREGALKTQVIADAAEIPTDTAKTWLDDLRLLGIATRGGVPQRGYEWQLRGEFQLTIQGAGLWAVEEGGGGDSVPLTDGREAGSEGDKITPTRAAPRSDSGTEASEAVNSPSSP